MMTEADPYDPMCIRYARDMEYLDSFWATSQEEVDSTPMSEREQKRADYIIHGEGTFNPTNGHFLCDNCYILAGMPTAPGGWICP